MNTRVIDDFVKEYFGLFLASKKETSVKQKKRYDVVLLANVTGIKIERKSSTIRIDPLTASALAT